MFELHSQLAKDCFVIGDFELCRLLLMNDSNFSWFILLPKRQNVSEIFELNETDQKQLLLESSFFSKKLVEHFKADKLNIAALGNVVPQLHVHHVVRYKNDLTFPSPILGKFPAKPYSNEEFDSLKQKLKNTLTQNFNFNF
ncbi:HIT domain-containing protein [bacterium]|nr:HIT domain-containing protein [bacterium]